MKIHRAITGSFIAAVTLLALAVPASAHVTIDPSSVPKGAGDATLTFRVPNEEANADTVKVDIQFPSDHPIAAVDVESPTNGWTAQVTTKHLDKPILTDDGEVNDVVSEIIWSGGKIAPGQYGAFRVLAMGIPNDVDSLTFKTIQTYSDGTAVSWIADSPAGGTEPEHPAPVLALSATATASAVGAPATQTVVKKQSNNALAITALIVGGIGVLIGVGAFLRKPRA